MHDGLVAEREQVRGGQAGALGVVDTRGQRRLGEVTLDDHDGDVQPERVRLAQHALVRDDHHERLDGLLEQLVHRRAQRLPRHREEADGREPVRRVPGGRLEREQHVGRPELAGAPGHHAERPRPRRRELFGREVAAVLQLLDGGHHPVVRVRPDPRHAVQHPGDGLVRDARASGHVRHPRHPRTLVGRGAHAQMVGPRRATPTT